MKLHKWLDEKAPWIDQTPDVSLTMKKPEYPEKPAKKVKVKKKKKENPDYENNKDVREHPPFSLADM